MPGLPFGAARQHPVPAELLTYEGIAGIEYIELDPDLPYPRSAAYRPAIAGGQLRVRDRVPEVADRELTRDEARAYLSALVSSGVFSWQRVYRPAQGTFVNVGVEWRLEVTFAKPKGARKEPRAFVVEGENVFPDGYSRVVSALMGSGLEGEASSAEEPRVE